MLEKLSLPLQTALNAELRSFERIQFANQPIPRGMMFSCLPLLFFAIPWTAFSLFWEWMALQPLLTSAQATQDAGGQAFGIIFPLFGIPFVLIGFGMLLAPLWVYRNAQKTVYAVTNQRALILTAGRTIKVESFSPADMNERAKRMRADGSGDLMFRSEENYYRGRRRVSQKGFHALPDVAQAERALDRLIEESKASNT